MEGSSLVKTRVLIMSDTHGFELEKLPKADVVMHCGDLTENGIPEDYERAIRMLGETNAELKLVIAGNHDLTLDRKFFESKGGDMNEHHRALDLWHGSLAREMKVILLDEGTHTFELSNGAKFTVYASPWTPKFGESAFQYETNEDRFNPAHLIALEAISVAEHLIPDFPEIDIVMTHGPPKYVLDGVSNGSNAGCPHLRRAVERARPRLHAFGHVHSQWGAQTVLWGQGEHEKTDDGYTMLPKPFIGRNQISRQGAAYQDLSRKGLEHGTATFLVNAAIMSENGQPSNVPWLLDLDLPAR
jgi:Icc-related predicted phosphoesterase